MTWTGAVPRRRRRVGYGIALTWLALAVLALGHRPLRAQEVAPAAPMTPYAIGGYWVYARSAPGQWATPLDTIRRLGGDTLVQFGPRLQPVVPDARATHPVLAACRLDDLPVLEASARDLQAAEPGAVLDRVFVYRTREFFGDRLVQQPGLDRSFTWDGQPHWRLLLPAPPAPAGPRGYDLVLVVGDAYDSVADLLAEAGRRAMRVFVGLPTPPPHPQYPWDPWLATMPVCAELTRRILVDYRERYGADPALQGIYQSLETPVSARPLPAVLNAYRAQHPLVRAELPGRLILVSPYWDARQAGGRQGTPPEAIAAGIQEIARCDVDIVAPQDSRGTGKVGLFWPHERDLPVDPRVQPAVVGATTYGEAYVAATRDYYEAAARGLDELAQADGRRVELWANLEAFEPGAGIPCGSFTTCQRTTKERLDRAITFAGARPRKLISFMWDSLYTCQGGRPATLAQEIAADAARPIVVDAVWERRGGQDGLRLQGHHLASATIDIETLSTGPHVAPRRLATGLRVQFETDRATNAPAAGTRHTVWVPARVSAEPLLVWAESPHGRAYHPLLVQAPAGPDPRR